MATTTIYKTFKVNGVLTDMTSVTLANALGTFGVKRNDTSAVVVDSGTAMAHPSTGVYSYTFAEPATGLEYTASVKVVYDGVTHYFEETVSGTPTPTSSSGSLDVDYTSLKDEVAFYLGYTKDSTAWTAQQIEDIDDYIQEGVRQFYWPPAISQEGRPDKVVRWSFLSPTTSLTTANATFQYSLPADFGGNAKSFTYADNASLSAITVISEARLRALQAGGHATGKPYYVAIRPKASTGSAPQAWEALLYPTPDAAYAILYTYDSTGQLLSTANPYPMGGPAHAETILESCLAVAEERTNDESSVHRNRFRELLLASIQYDATFSSQEGESWPANDTVSTTLDVTYNDLLRQVGHFMGFGWDSAAWDIPQRRQVDMAIHSGMRSFYNPPPLPGEKYGHEWSFLRPVTTLTTSAPYATGTVTIAAGVATILGGTWPSWSATGVLTVNGSTYTVATRTSGTEIVLSDASVAVATASTFSISPVTYSLPTDFAAIDGPMTFAPGLTTLYPPIELVPEYQIRAKLSQENWTGMPQLAAIRPKTIDETAKTAYEIMFWPIPDAAYVLSYRYQVNILALSSTNVYPPGGQPHAETILESCLAAAERARDGQEGIHTKRFWECLMASVSADRKSASPETVGYNRDASDKPLSCFNGNWHDNDANVVTLNGVAY